MIRKTAKNCKQNLLKLRKIYCLSNTFWVYQHRVKYVPFQFYSHLLLIIFNLSTLYKKRLDSFFRLCFPWDLLSIVCFWHFNTIFQNYGVARPQTRNSLGERQYSFGMADMDWGWKKRYSRVQNTVWKFQIFPATKILREINFGHFKAQKTAIFAICTALNFEHLGI